MGIGEWASRVPSASGEDAFLSTPNSIGNFSPFRRTHNQYMALPILTLICWNSYCTFLLGIILNVLLVYLAKKYSTAELKDYRCLIYYICLLNSLLLTFHAALEPLFFIAFNGTSYMFLAGSLARNGSIAIRLFLTSFYFSLIILAFYGQALQFLDRYLLICRNITNKKYRHALMVFILVFLGSQMVVTMKCTMPSLDHQISDLLGNSSSILTRDLAAKENMPKVAMEIDMGNSTTRNLFLRIVGTLLVCYFVIVICFFRIRAFIKKHLMEKSGGSKREFIRQITLNMLVQACLPLYCITIYAACIGLMFTRYSASPFLLQFEMMSVGLVAWLPVLNPLVTILSIRKYRRGFLNSFLMITLETEV